MYHAPMSPATQHLVLYDGGCRLCTRSKRWLTRLDWRGRLRLADITTEWDRLSRVHPTLRFEACTRSMDVVAPDGRITSGFDALRTIAWVVPTLTWLAPLLYFPGVPFVGRRVYGFVARHRACHAPTPGPR